MKNGRLLRWSLCFLFVLLCIASAHAEVALDEAHFPDADFREYLSGYDRDGNGVLGDEELRSVTYIMMLSGQHPQLASLQGVEYLTELKSLILSSKRDLVSVDLSRNTKLEELQLDLCGLTELDVSQNTALRTLNCEANKLTELDVSMCPSLEKLMCRGNQLSSLRLGENRNLTSLSFYSNPTLKKLDISGCRNLTEIIGGSCGLTEFSLIGCDHLRKVELGGNQITYLDLGGTFNYTLEELNVNYLKLGELDVSEFGNLRRLECLGGQLTALTVPGRLEELVCGTNLFESLDVSACERLTKLYCTLSKLTSLDLSHNTRLEKLDLTYSANLKYLDVHTNTALKELKLQGCALACMDVTGLGSLTTFYCDYNRQTVSFTDGVFNTGLLPGFSPSCAHDFEGGTMEGGELRLNEGSSQISYTYECGQGYAKVFTLVSDVQSDPPPTLKPITTPTASPTANNKVTPTPTPTVINKVTPTPSPTQIGKVTPAPSITPAPTAAPTGTPSPTPTAEPDATPVPGGIAIDEAHFPDAAFRAFVSENFDADADGFLSEEEAAAVTEISVSGIREIASLSGIAYFPSLAELGCASCALISLDVSENPALEALECGGNMLVCLDLNENTRLTSFDCEDNRRAVTAPGGRFDLAELDGFEFAKASEWTGGTAADGVLTVEASGDVTYMYDCGGGHRALFTLEVTVQDEADHIPGDADGSGEPDMEDALTVLQYLCGEDVGMNAANADVNGDGIIDKYDALLILQYDCGWDVELN